MLCPPVLSVPPDFPFNFPSSCIAWAPCMLLVSQPIVTEGAPEYCDRGLQHASCVKNRAMILAVLPLAAAVCCCCFHLYFFLPVTSASNLTGVFTCSLLPPVQPPCSDFESPTSSFSSPLWESAQYLAAARWFLVLCVRAACGAVPTCAAGVLHSLLFLLAHLPL